jgi:hypothetical protein
MVASLGFAISASRPKGVSGLEWRRGVAEAVSRGARGETGSLEVGATMAEEVVIIILYVGFCVVISTISIRAELLGHQEYHEVQ